MDEVRSRGLHKKPGFCRKQVRLPPIVQLAREFANFAKAEPQRVIRLIERFEPSFGERAAGYSLAAMAATANPAVLTSTIISLAGRGFEGDEFRRSAAMGIENIPDFSETPQPTLAEPRTFHSADGRSIHPLPRPDRGGIPLPVTEGASCMRSIRITGRMMMAVEMAACVRASRNLRRNCRNVTTAPMAPSWPA
jgi:hypothetical protein